MKKTLILLAVLLGTSTWAATTVTEGTTPTARAAVSSTAIILYRDITTEIRTFLGIREPRSLYPWEAKKALEKATIEGNTSILHHLVERSSSLQLTPADFGKALFIAVTKNQKEAAEILLTSPILANLSLENTRSMLVTIFNSFDFYDLEVNREEIHRLALFFQTLPLRIAHILERQEMPSGHFALPTLQAYQEFSLAAAVAPKGFSDIVNLIDPDTLRAFDQRTLYMAMYTASTNGHLEVYHQLKGALDLTNLESRIFLFLAAARVGDLSTLHTLPILPNMNRDALARLVLKEAAFSTQRNSLYIDPEGCIFSENPGGAPRHILEDVLREGGEFNISPAMIKDFLSTEKDVRHLSPEAATILSNRLTPHLSALLDDEAAAHPEVVYQYPLFRAMDGNSHISTLQALYRRCLEALPHDQLLKLYNTLPSTFALSIMQTRGISTSVMNGLIRDYVLYTPLLGAFPAEFMPVINSTDLMDRIFN